jgi:hypothetical protein
VNAEAGAKAVADDLGVFVTPATGANSLIVTLPDGV